MNPGTVQGGRVAWFHPFAGIAGDMALGALIDAGADAGAVEATCRRLDVSGWRLDVQRVDRGGLAGVAVRVVVEEHQDHRRARDIVDLIGSAGLVDRVAHRAIAVFRRLAVVEAALHGTEPDDVVFHEVGAVDSIVDTVGVAAALEDLGIDDIHCGPVAVGVGTISAAHGLLPNPAPAVTRLLVGLPVRGVEEAKELTTPTGAAIVAALATRFGAVPDMTVTSSGYGAGQRNDVGRPNLLQVMVGDLPSVPSGTTETISVLQSTVDDVTGEVLAHTLRRCLQAGALDAWITPVTMKKGRPGHVLTVLGTPARAAALIAVLAEETGTLGVRHRVEQRWVAPRRTERVNIGGNTVRVKSGPFRAKAEHDDVVKAADDLQRSYRSVAEEAERSTAPPVAGPGENQDDRDGMSNG